MNLKHRILFCFLIFTFISCQPDNDNPPSPAQFDTKEFSIVHFLIFKKEKKLEVWATKKNSDKEFVKSYQNIFQERTPIGIFQLDPESSEKLALVIPNAYMAQQIGDMELSELFILSNEMKSDSSESIFMKENEVNELKRFVSEKIKTQVFIFPNDLRVDGKFESCYGCPHQMAEIYSSLELHLNNFSKKE